MHTIRTKIDTQHVLLLIYGAGYIAKEHVNMTDSALRDYVNGIYTKGFQQAMPDHDVIRSASGIRKVEVLRKW
jgi:hypothetical protein